MPWLFMFKQGTFPNGSGPGIILFFGQLTNSQKAKGNNWTNNLGKGFSRSQKTMLHYAATIVITAGEILKYSHSRNSKDNGN